ncbi:MAG: U32 family peptidase C-terminal domain-containing protein [Thermodesulfobacteriota bacterium]
MTGDRIELLAPAGNFEKLEVAVHYGADAVYMGGKAFSLRNFSGNFELENMADAVAYARRHGVFAYVACNVFPRVSEEQPLIDYLKALGRIGPDAIIVADPGIFMTARQVIPEIPLHVSTQANTTSRMSAQFWAGLGARRINAARELTLSEIGAIATATPLEIEAFAHGSMCISYSGRCLLSSFMARRDSNRGECAHPCRWQYHVVEQKRPGRYMPIAEDERGSYIFNAKDLCMIAHIPEMIDAGIDSLKIEGRMKGVNYLAAAVCAYRQAIDTYYADPDNYAVNPCWQKALDEINYRGYGTGFYFNDADSLAPNYQSAKQAVRHHYVGKIVDRPDDARLVVDIRNRIGRAEAIEIQGPSGPPRQNRITRIIGAAGDELPMAQPNCRVTLHLAEADAASGPKDVIRRS